MKNYFKIVTKLVMGLGTKEEFEVDPLDVALISIFVGMCFLGLIGSLLMIVSLLS